MLVRTLTFGPDGSVLAIDPATHQIVGAPVQLEAVRISPITNQIVGEPLPLPFPPYAIAVSITDAWIGVSASGNEADPSDDRVVRIDLATNMIIDTLHAGGRPIALVIGAGSLWVATVQPSSIVQIVP